MNKRYVKSPLATYQRQQRKIITRKKYRLRQRGLENRAVISLQRLLVHYQHAAHPVYSIEQSYLNTHHAAGVVEYLILSSIFYYYR
jgi:hypothetical protein